jgi:hypothetical protein
MILCLFLSACGKPEILIPYSTINVKYIDICNTHLDYCLKDKNRYGVCEITYHDCLMSCPGAYEAKAVVR